MRTRRHIILRRLSFAALATTLAVAGVACSGDDEEATPDPSTTVTAAPDTSAPSNKPVVGGRIVVAGEAEAGTPWLPGAVQCDSYCQMRARTFYEPIAAVDEDLKVHPYLAESITPNADYTEWTVKLRSGITFSNGEPLNADAAIKNIQVNLNAPLIAAAVKDLARVSATEFKVEKVDDLTVKLFTGLNGDPTKPVPWPGFDVYLGGQAAFMAAPSYIDKALADKTGVEATKPIGTGPFVLSSFIPQDRLVVKRNPTYWRKDADGVQLPYLDEIEFRVIPDANTRQQALESRDVDMISTSNANSIADLRTKADKFPMIEQAEYGETFYVLLNLTNPQLQSRDLRCAMLQAIDKQAIIDLTGGGILTPANGPFAPGQEGYLEDNGSLPYDPTAAKAGVEAFKAANGGQAPKIIYSAVPDADSLTTAQYLQQVWGDAGIEVELKQIEQSTLIGNAVFGAPDFNAFGWRNHAGVFVDGQFFWWHSSSAADPGQFALNFGRLKDPVIDDLLAKQRSELDTVKRKGLAEDINRQFAKECWILPTSWAIWGIAHNGSIAGIGQLTQPDGSGKLVRDGAGFPGQVWLTGVWKKS